MTNTLPYSTYMTYFDFFIYYNTYCYNVIIVNIETLNKAYSWLFSFSWSNIRWTWNGATV